MRKKPKKPKKPKKSLLTFRFSRRHFSYVFIDVTQQTNSDDKKQKTENPIEFGNLFFTL